MKKEFTFKDERELIEYCWVYADYLPESIGIGYGFTPIYKLLDKEVEKKNGFTRTILYYYHGDERIIIDYITNSVTYDLFNFVIQERVLGTIKIRFELNDLDDIYISKEVEKNINRIYAEITEGV